MLGHSRRALGAISAIFLKGLLWLSAILAGELTAENFFASGRSALTASEVSGAGGKGVNRLAGELSDNPPQFAAELVRAKLAEVIASPIFAFRDTEKLLPPEAVPLRQELEAHVLQWIRGGKLAPLRVDIGLAGEELFFVESGDVFLALSLALAHLSWSARAEVKAFLAEQWREHMPVGQNRIYHPQEGKRRELYKLPPVVFSAMNPGSRPHAMAHVYAVWSYGYYAEETERWADTWELVRETWREFRQQKLPPRSQEDQLWANAYLGGLIGFIRIAGHLGHRTEADEARADAERLASWLLERFAQAALHLQLPEFQGIAWFDRWREEDLGGFFLVLRSHRAKPDKFHALVPEVGVLLGGLAPQAGAAYLDFVDKSLPGWYLVGEERQLHYGENFTDYPDFSLALFQGQAYVGGRSFRSLSAWVDLPICDGDPAFVQKAAIALHVASAEQTSRWPFPARTN